MQCEATTRRGRRCRNEAAPGSDLCRTHQPALDPATIQQLLQMLRAGNYLEVAAIATGLTADEISRSPALQAEIEQAKAEGEVRTIARIAQAAGDNWQAAAWLAERQHPERWARPARREGERPPPLPAPPDALDELAGRRRARRSRV